MSKLLNDKFLKGNLTAVQYITAIYAEAKESKQALHSMRYELQQILGERELSKNEIKELLDLIDTEYRTSEERVIIINSLRQNFRYRSESYRDMFLGCLFYHRSVLAAFADGYTLNPSEMKRVWRRDGKALLKRSQRKLREYISLCELFSEHISSDELEFGVHMACKMSRPNLTSLLLGEYQNKLNESQLERLDAMKTAFVMMGQGDFF